MSAAVVQKKSGGADRREDPGERVSAMSYSLQ